MNLAVNARDAMPKGGRLTIETSEADLDGRYASPHADVRPGHYALLAVSDSGCGMTPEVQGRAFEPFFTTKGVGKGTGLGLAVVHGIVKGAGGHVAVYSEVGVGTTFKVYLPRAEGTAEARPSAGLPVPGGRETVLLVEDDGAIRNLAGRVLEGCGYAVIAAQDGQEALRAAAGHGGRFDLLVTDVVMPKMGGGQLAEALRGLHPGLKVLFLSGYADDAVVRHGVLQRGAAFLQKPFTLAALARKVRETIDAVGAAQP
jgi:two-component system cell cycle sensor histidine kinase/response regulator CckA